MSTILEELEAIRTKYHNLQREWDSQQEHLGRVQGEMFRMRSQLKSQSSFCASMGAIMGSLMWKTTRMASVVDVLLSTNRVSEFLCIVSGSLESFMETYTLTLPDVSTSEMQFILSLVGIVANVAATPDGRQFLVTDPNGKELIDQMISALLSIRDETGDSLKRVILMSLYNLSINQLGLIVLLDHTSLFGELAKDIQSDSNPELRLLSLRLLQSLTMQIPSTKAFDDMYHAIPMDKIKELTNTTDADMRLLAKNILQSLERAYTKFGAQTPDSTTSGIDICRRDPANKSVCSLLSSV
ncbi:heat shock factor 2-binding protein-like isoform X2 [Macrosteles quadrilineatus]|nr:heat shock factor 2-binding protein-like isoform X2 [Macrosteles quadrilineatus]